MSRPTGPDAPTSPGEACAGPTPVTILTGFLGSGKTTLLQRALRSPGMADTAVIINEAGEMGLDHLLIETVEDQVVELPNGCLCCVRRLDIATTLRDLIIRRDAGSIRSFSRIVIETSGLADPAPILYTLAADPMLGHEVSLRAVVTLIDAVAGLATLGTHPEARSQVAVADRVVVTKGDLATPSSALAATLDGLNGWAERVAAGPEADPAALLVTPPAAAPILRSFAPEAAAHTDGLVTVSLVLRTPPTRLAFATMLGRFAAERGEDLLRVKGLMAFADRPGAVAVIHAVQHTIYRPQWLERWPDRDARCRLVFVLRGLEAGEVFARFAAADPAPWSPLPTGFACLPAETDAFAAV